MRLERSNHRGDLSEVARGARGDRRTQTHILEHPSDLAPLPLPGRVELHPKTWFGPVRQRLVQLSSGVEKPCGKLVLLMWYLGCTCPAVYTSWPAAPIGSVATV